MKLHSILHILRLIEKEVLLFWFSKQELTFGKRYMLCDGHLEKLLDWVAGSGGSDVFLLLLLVVLYFCFSFKFDIELLE